MGFKVDVLSSNSSNVGGDSATLTLELALASGAPCSGSAKIIETLAATGAVLFASDDDLHAGWR